MRYRIYLPIIFKQSVPPLNQIFNILHCQNRDRVISIIIITISKYSNKGRHNVSDNHGKDICPLFVNEIAWSHNEVLWKYQSITPWRITFMDLLGKYVKNHQTNSILLLTTEYFDKSLIIISVLSPNNVLMSLLFLLIYKYLNGHIFLMFCLWK